MKRLLPVIAILAGVVLVSCSGEVEGSPEVCEPDILDSSGDVQAASQEIEVWALFFATYAGLEHGEPVFVPQGEEIKIVWRATGEGDVSFQALGPNGSTITPIWGPEGHLSSSWDGHPGEEWGTGWIFPEEGCWSIELRRDDSVAYLDVDIRA
jgi:hypothetical protein